jgi:V8-like Glu-specific endopeptidase
VTKSKFLLLSSLLFLIASCQVENKTTSDAKVVSSWAVIGNDERTEVENIVYKPENFYQYSVGRLTFQSKSNLNQTNECTGTLIGKYHIITAAHCVYHSGELIESGYFDPSMVGVKNIREHRFFIEKIWLKPSFMRLVDLDLDSAKHDIAILKIKKLSGQGVPGDLFGYMGRESTVSLRENTKVIIAGYPGDKLDGSLWESRCIVKEMKEGSVNHKYNCDTTTGMSGGPVIKYNTITNENLIVGVHVDYIITENINEFITFDTEISEDINKIIAGLDDEVKHFEEKTILLKPKNSVYFHNKCNVDMYVGIRYKNLDSEWITDGYKVVKPGKVHNFINTKTRHYYYYAQDYEGDIVFSGDHETYLQNDYKFFKKVSLEPHWQVKTHSFSCDN